GEERRSPTVAKEVSWIQLHERTRTEAADRPQGHRSLQGADSGADPENPRHQPAARWSRRSRLICEDGSDTSATVKRLRCCTTLKRGYAADCGRWCGSNGSADGHGSASFANGASVRTWQHKRPGALTVRGGSRTRPLWRLPCLMPTLQIGR